MTEYFKGTRVRTDSFPLYTSVLDYDHRRQVNWRTDLRQYAIVEWPPEPRIDATAPGRVIEIERVTTDTGERKRFFGRPARHLITRETRSDGPEATIDGWYIDAPGLPKWKGGAGSFGVIVATSGRSPAPPRIQVKQRGPATEGLAVWQKTTSLLMLPTGSRHTTETVSEITALAEGPLPNSLFEPPSGYQRVATVLPPAK